MWINPYDNYLEGGYKHIRSNFHTHAGQIDKCSINTIEDTLTLYQNLGYGLLTISNHNVYTPMQASNKPDQAVKFLDGYEHTVPNQHMLWTQQVYEQNWFHE